MKALVVITEIVVDGWYVFDDKKVLGVFANTPTIDRLNEAIDIEVSLRVARHSKTHKIMRRINMLPTKVGDIRTYTGLWNDQLYVHFRLEDVPVL